MLGVKKLVHWVEARPIVKIYVLPVLATIPVSIVGSTALLPTVEEWLKEHPHATLLFIFWPGLMVILSGVYTNLQPVQLNHTELHFLLKTLGNILGKKVKRFSDFYRKQTPRQAPDILNQLVHPEEQIQGIVEGVYQYFEASRPRDVPAHQLNLRVALAKMGKRHIEQFEFFYPLDQAPRSNVSQMQDDTCGFSRAKEKKKLIISEDNVKEAKRRDRNFLVTDRTRALDEGSMLCYPVTIRGEADDVPLVLSVSAGVKEYFKKEQSELYVSVLKYFEQRIVLEYYLKSIKSRALEGHTPNLP